MDPLYLVIIVILMALAVSDLIVGVSNDAVNFLNSAIGSKAAPRWAILMIASVGILIGSIFSTGMMEVARSGIFFPGQFSFHDVMLLFLAVMITDVILLDMFNTLGLPTSTTVSLVFELLGAAVAVSLYTTWGTSESLAEYINASKALGIISGILLSVVIAFTTGIIVMFFSRVVFTFNFKRNLKYIGALWCGVALTAISYFAIFKGLKDTNLLSADIKDFISNNTVMLVVASFGFWTLLVAFFQYVFRINILKFTVLMGTLSLALAFAGNDLVNFIGVSMAGFSSYEIAQDHIASGGALESLKMTALAGDVAVPTLYLVGAGVIMTITLWFSKKARTVTETEINLARDGGGDERFGSSVLSRALVRGAFRFNEHYMRWTPKPVQRFISRRFEPCVEVQKDKAPFDLIRATVNLAAASILISIATSYKLPLSTTYVTFMVAMGTSLADRAWGRESAVYRITGVITVVGGWFMTAFVAFTVAAIIALLLMQFQTVAVYALAALCVFLLIQSKLLYKRREARKKAQAMEREEKKQGDSAMICKTNQEMLEGLDKVRTTYTNALDALMANNRRGLKDMLKVGKEIKTLAKDKNHQLVDVLRTFVDTDKQKGHYYIQLLSHFDEISNALQHIIQPCFDHIDNLHTCFGGEQRSDIEYLSEAVDKFLEVQIAKFNSTEPFDLQALLAERDEFFVLVNKVLNNQVHRVAEQDLSSRGTMLYLTIINETKTMIIHSTSMVKAHGLMNAK